MSDPGSTGDEGAVGERDGVTAPDAAGGATRHPVTTVRRLRREAWVFAVG
jgi:hypothetical protein